MFGLKTILTTLISTGIAGSVVTSPVTVNETNLARTKEPQLTLSQINYHNNPEQNELDSRLKNIIGVTGLAMGTIAIAYNLNKARQPSLANSSLKWNNSNSLLDRVSPKLRRELLRLINDRATVDRLLNGTSRIHPGRSANWIAEKVIYDLKRGR